MRYLTATLLLTAITFTGTAKADHNLLTASCDYHHSIEVVADQLQRDRYTSRYVVSYVDRLHRAACQLHDAIKVDPNCPRVLAMFEDVCTLHARVDSLLNSACRRQTQMAVYWRDSALLMEELRCAFQPQPVVARRVIISSPTLPPPSVRYPTTRSRGGFSFELNYGSRSRLNQAAPIQRAPVINQRPSVISDPHSRRREIERQRSQHSVNNRNLNSRNLNSNSHQRMVSSLLSGLFN